jgi:mannose-6-phosphate isomerase-like protein (cupin superfamily)
MRTCLAIVFAAFSAALPAADHPDIMHWPAADLQERHEKLVEQLAQKNAEGVQHPWQQGMAGMSLGLRRSAGRNHHASMIHRSGYSYAEAHDTLADVYFVVAGGGTLVLGGEMVDRVAVPGQPGEYRAPKIRGGKRFQIGKGDVINIPAGTPHQMVFEEGEFVTYVMVKVVEPAGGEPRE